MSNNAKVKVRFAPSPTGHLHIGGARTALFNYLYAKRMGGSFLLRIEDTDLERSTVECEKVIIDGLKWFGINWDEGIEVGGDEGPYRSTERIDIYKPYIERLLNNGDAYYCYCTQEELEAERQELMAKGEMPRYLGQCRNLAPEQKRKYEQEGRKPTIRFKVPEGKVIKVNDIVRDTVEFESDGIGDFIIVKSDGIPVYNFAVVIDDYLMKITHVIRGEEHLSNTPRQILIYEALGINVPAFAHVSLILGKDRTKMSKRHGSTWVEQYIDAGYLPEALINFLVLMGWSPGEEREIFSMEELEQRFSLERVSKNPAVFDIDKLNWMNGQYIKNTPVERITQLAIPHLIKAGFIKENEKVDLEWLEKVVGIVQGELSFVGEIPEKAAIFFDDNVEPKDIEAEEVMKMEHVPELVKAFKNKVSSVQTIDDEFAKGVFKEIQNQTGIKGKNLYMPIRVALTGQVHGPEIVEILKILGREKLIKRLSKH
ncbi:MAG: glutamate--tRNA ligase [Ignavibacteriales bacterium]